MSLAIVWHTSDASHSHQEKYGIIHKGTWRVVHEMIVNFLFYSFLCLGAENTSACNTHLSILSFPSFWQSKKDYYSARSQVPDRVPEVTIFYFVCGWCDVSSLLPPTSFHLRWHKVVCPPTWFPPTQSLIAWQLWLGSRKFALKSQHLRTSAREFYTVWMIEALFHLCVAMTSI